jgi:hypothetical protein
MWRLKQLSRSGADDRLCPTISSQPACARRRANAPAMGLIAPPIGALGLRGIPAFIEIETVPANEASTTGCDMAERNRQVRAKKPRKTLPLVLVARPRGARKGHLS